LFFAAPLLFAFATLLTTASTSRQWDVSRAVGGHESKAKTSKAKSPSSNVAGRSAEELFLQMMIDVVAGIKELS